MKGHLCLWLCFLALTLALGGCGKQPENRPAADPTQASVRTTEPAEIPVSAPTTQHTTPVTVPTEPEPAESTPTEPTPTEPTPTQTHPAQIPGGNVDEDELPPIIVG